MKLKERQYIVKRHIFNDKNPQRDRNRLRDDLLSVIGGPAGDYKAHHILNNANKENFAVWGFDVDDYRNGQGVLIREIAHRGWPDWHQDVDKEWTELFKFINDEQNNVSWQDGRQMIKAFRDGPARQAVIELANRYDLPPDAPPIYKWPTD